MFESYLLQSRVIEKESKKTDEKGRVRAGTTQYKKLAPNALWFTY